MDSNIQNTSKQIRKHGHVFKHIMFVNLRMLKINKFECVEQIWSIWAPKMDEDLSKQILENLDMAPISTRKHEMKIW